jgi:hypothetical protein
MAPGATDQSLHNQALLPLIRVTVAKVAVAVLITTVLRVVVELLSCE